MFDAMYPEATDAVLRDRARRPADAAGGSGPGLFSGFWSAVKGAAVVAPTEALRAVTAVSEAYGKAAAPANRGALSVVDPGTLERMDRHVDQDVQAPLRATIERYSPDPATTGTASQIVFGAGKVIGKAAGYSLVGGFPGAVVGTGLDEGINETLKLRDRGVDLPTAAKVGAVHGAATALGIAAPIAGRTVLQTVGLTAAAGPGLFMLENQAARTILEQADYADIARDYDPLDPVGLGVSTLLPAAVGAAAHGVRARRARGAVPPTRDEVAAAHTVMAAEQVDRSSLAAVGDVEAAGRHVDVLARTARELDLGEPVTAAIDAPVDPVALAAVVRRMEQAATPEALQAAREAEAELAALDADPLRNREAVVMPETAPAPKFVPTGEFTEEGRPVMRPLDDIVREADADGQDGRAFSAAINCFLGA